MFLGSLFFFLSLLPVFSVEAMVCQTIFERTVERAHITVDGGRRELQIFHPLKKLKAAPVVIYFHGTNAPVVPRRPNGVAYGLEHESVFIQQLTEVGFVVIAPTANQIVPYLIFPSVTAWEANIVPYSQNFERTRDFALSKALFESLETIADRPVDRNNIFLAGFSSGGYMASRLALEAEFANKIRGIIIHSASYGTCLASQCSIPRDLPDWHPPTLLVSNKDDSIVPHYTVEMYLSRLEKNKIPTQTLFSNQGDHAWNKDHPQQILLWTRQFLKKK